MLQILCGPDRTANSMRILDQICENARAGVAGQILIVPEQYSHETERALCARGGDTISRYAEVLSLRGWLRGCFPSAAAFARNIWTKTAAC